MTSKQFITKLHEIGYFEYTEPDKIKSVEESLRTHFENKEFMTEINNNPPFEAFDMRFYGCGDGEELYEEGGAISLIEEMKPLFNKIGIQINYSQDTYIESTHTILVNNKVYTLAEGSILMWGETFAKFSEMINAELEIHKSKERIYLVTNENGYMVFLTTEQHEFISKCFQNEKGPITVNEWVDKNTSELYKFLDK